MVVRELPDFWGVYDDLDKNRRNLRIFMSDHHEVRPPRNSDSKHPTIASSSHPE